uniref:Transcription factor IIIA n=1 Tax=Solanum lycopersicum TaxID=4081 RepID=Q06HM6_SOLLC|nr:transcription factor IIIA [Solanum lycopersicum]ABI85394.1 transcription factor IIIA [Solanum lycopersicum]
MGEVGEEKREVVFRDIRRYYCEFCGLCRSKKSLISSHIQSHHQDVIESLKDDATENAKGSKMNICEECGATFQKPAHLKQHLQSHSLEIEIF